MNTWAIYFLVVGIFCIVIEIHLLWRYWPWLGRYRITKTLTAIFSPSGVFFGVWLIWEYYNIMNRKPLFVPPIHIKIGTLIITTLFSVILIFIFLYMPHNWINRRKNMFNRRFGPYLAYGKDASSEVIIMWGAKTRYGRLIQKKPLDSFKIGKNKNNLKSIHEIEKKEQFKIEMGETLLTQFIKVFKLEPNTTYYYQLPFKNSIYRFSTGPSTKENDIDEISFQFVALSDLHASGATIKKTLNLIKKNAPESKFVVCAGDNVSDGRIITHWRTFFGQIKDISTNLPFMTVPGNHDGEFPKMAKYWKNLFSYNYPDQERGFYYSMYYQNVAFFFIDNYNAGEERITPSEDQIHWLKKELKDISENIDFKIFVFHKPLYSTGDFGCDKELENILLPIIDEYGVNVVINGHSHIFEAYHRNETKETILLICGGGGARLDYCVIRSFSDTPYKWSGKVQKCDESFFYKGDLSHPGRNDEPIKKYHEIGKLTHHILVFEVKKKYLEVKAIERNGNVIYRRNIAIDGK